VHPINGGLCGKIRLVITKVCALRFVLYLSVYIEIPHSIGRFFTYIKIQDSENAFIPVASEANLSCEN
jgi:hypothetical protein